MNDTTQQANAQLEKLSIFRFMLQHRDSVFVHFSPLHGDALVPFRLQNQVQVVLQVGLNMPVPIPDLHFDEVGFSGTLSFKGVPFKVQVPWEACFALVDPTGKGKVWSSDMPAELLQQMEEKSLETRKTQQYLRPVNKVAEKAGWGVIDGGKT